MAPELINKKRKPFKITEEQMKRSDIWSFGIYFMIFSVFNAIHHGRRGHVRAVSFPKYYKKTSYLNKMIFWVNSLILM